MKKILVLEDEENIRSFVVINLKRAGYETVEAGTGEEALAQLKQNPGIRVALLDIMLPDIDGFEVCRRIRAMDNKIGIIMLTARTQEMDKVTGLMTGADDYVTKPFSPAELTARVDALFRRTGAGEADSGGVRHREAVHGEPGQGTVPGRDLGRGVGAGLLWRAENRGCEHPPPPHQDRGRRHEPGLYHHRVGIWVQVGRISRLPGASSGAPQSGARGSASMLRSAKHWRRGNSFAPSIGKKRGPQRASSLGRDATNPVYITTVWGYGYK